MDKEDMGYLNPDVEFEYLTDVEKVPEPVYEAIPSGPGMYIDPKWFMAGFAEGIKEGLENMCPCRPAPIEVEAEVIKTEINKPTRGLLGDG